MVRIAVAAQLSKDRVKTVEAASAQLIEARRQRLVRPEVVQGRILGPKPVIEAVGVFTPAKDLADHTFQASQWHLLL